MSNITLIFAVSRGHTTTQKPLDKRSNMQRNKILVINPKSFPEIWAALTEQQKDDLSIKFYQSQCCKTRQTVWNWAKGVFKPLPLHRNVIADILTKYLGEKFYAHTLFPES